MGECSVCSITPHKSGGLLSLPVLPLNYLSPVRTYSSSLMASSHCSSHATRHHGKSPHMLHISTGMKEWDGSQTSFSFMDMQDQNFMHKITLVLLVLS